MEAKNKGIYLSTSTGEVAYMAEWSNPEEYRNINPMNTQIFDLGIDTHIYHFN